MGIELFSAEHYELMLMFEKEYYWFNHVKHEKEHWEDGEIYWNKNTNEMFLAYRRGYVFGKTVHS